MSSCPKQLPLAVLATNICGEAQSSFSTSVPQPQPCLLEGNTDLSVIVGHLRDSYSLHHTVCLYTQAVHNQSYGYLSENDNRSSFLFALCDLLNCSRIPRLISVINDKTNTTAVKSLEGCTNYRG